MNNELNEQIIAKLRKELLWTRIFSIITSVLMVCILIGGIVISNQLREYEAQIKPAVEQLEQLDVNAFNEALNQMSIVVASVDWVMLNDSIASVDWEKVSKQLESLDVDALNAAIEGLDTEELTEALENMNDAVEKLRGIADAFSAFGGKLGIGRN